MPWSYDGLATPPPPAYRPQPAVVARYEPPAVERTYLMADRHKLRTWSSPDLDKLRAFVARIDGMDYDQAIAAVDRIARGP